MITITNGVWAIEDVAGVIFDKDGTLIDSHVYWGKIIENRAKAIMKYYSLHEKLYEKLCFTMGYSTTSKRLLPEGPIALVSREEVITILYEFLTVENVVTTKNVLSEIFINTHNEFKKEVLKYVHGLPAVAKFIEQLKRNNVKMALVTSDSVEVTKEILDKLNLIDSFEIIIGKESTKESKLTGIPATKAVDAMNLDASKVICIGDAPVDAIMGQKSGLQACICVITGQTGRYLLQEYSPYIIETMEELQVK